MDYFKKPKRLYAPLTDRGGGSGGGGSRPSLPGVADKSSVGQVWVCPTDPDDVFVRRTGSEPVPKCTCGAARTLKTP